MNKLALPFAIVAFAVASTIGSAQAAPIINGKVYEESFERDCGVESLCQIPFSKVDPGKTLTVNRVSCVILKNAAVNTFAVALGQISGPGAFVKRPQFLTPTKIGVGSGIESYQSNDTVALIIQANTRPGVSMSTVGGPTGTMVLSCTIIGKLN